MRTQALTETAAARVAEAGAAETAAARAAETATQQVIIQFDIFFRNFIFNANGLITERSANGRRTNYF